MFLQLLAEVGDNFLGFSIWFGECFVFLFSGKLVEKESGEETTDGFLSSGLWAADSCDKFEHGVFRKALLVAFF